MTDVVGAGVSAYASMPELDEGSYIKTQALVYPGQNEPTQDGGTGDRPVQVLQRAIKQSIKVTKDISQASYDGVNTYGAVPVSYTHLDVYKRQPLGSQFI